MSAVTAERTRLRFDNMRNAAVVADVESQGARCLTVRRPLPFLRLEGGVVDERGRRARVNDVWLSLEDETPTLVVDLVYDD